MARKNITQNELNTAVGAKCRVGRHINGQYIVVRIADNKIIGRGDTAREAKMNAIEAS